VDRVVRARWETNMASEHLYRRGKIWWAWTVDPQTGEQARFSTGATDKTAARIVLAGRERDAADPDTARKKQATLGDAFALLLADRASLVKAGKRSEATVDFYTDHLRPWYLFAGRVARRIGADRRDDAFTSEEREQLIELGKCAALIDAGDERFVDAFILHRRANETSENTVSKDRATFRAALKLAKRARIWAGDLELLFPAGFSPEYVPDRLFLTREQGFALLRAFDAVPTGHGDEVVAQHHRRAYLAFILATGADAGDVPRALREDVARRDLVRVRGTKNKNRDRCVPIITTWQRELLAYVRKHADGEGGMLFSSWGNIRRSLVAACDRGGVPPIGPRRLRHTYSHWLKAEGIHHDELAPAMGHADTRMLDRVYGRTEGDELRKAMLGSVAERRAALRVVQGGKAAKPRRRANG
jgi:integrase